MSGWTLPGLLANLGATVAFTVPWALAALGVLPVIWWLLRVTPPAPQRLRFPPLALLRDLIGREETAQRTPWWLLALRLMIAALVILALAGPVLNPNRGAASRGPLVVVVDNGWAAGHRWDDRRQALDRLTDAAERQGRSVAIVATAPPATGGGVTTTGFQTAGDARRTARALAPQPWTTDHTAAAAAVRALAIPGNGQGEGVWLSDGLDSPGGLDLAAALQRKLGSATVIEPGPGARADLLSPGDAGRADLSAELIRAESSVEAVTTVRAVAEDGRLLARETVVVPPGESRRTITFNLPTELRNAAVSLRIERQETAGAVALLDERWRRRPVGLVSGRPDGESQPLLSDLYYLHRALEPYTEVSVSTVATLLQRQLALLVLSDVGTLTRAETDDISAWVRRGGVLVRFAGPRMTHAGDPLIPVRLRAGNRSLGGAMSWSEPASLQPFDPASPFAGLSIPPDVVVNRQVLAEPTADLAEHTWARLADGTPLVTAGRLGDGRIVLIHTTASPDWSNLPLSGLLVEMLQRLVGLSHGAVAAAGTDGNPAAATPAIVPALDPAAVLDGFGHLGAPLATTMPLAASDLERKGAIIAPNHPPGFYGSGENRRAVNLAPTILAAGTFGPLGALPSGVTRQSYGTAREIPLQPWLLIAAVVLLLADWLAALALRGYLHPARRLARGAAGLIAVALITGSTLLPSPLHAAESEAPLPATAENVLAYIRSGDKTVDAVSQAGLRGLQFVLNQRTAVETVGVVGLDVERDELAFYPLIYWPMSPQQAGLSDTARGRVDSYLRHGGVILFDTREAVAGSSPGAGTGPLRRILDGIAVPPLSPVPTDHVLTKAFYLMSEFPGRYADGTLWVEASDEQRNDGVSSVIIGENDYAAAWAMDTGGQPLYSVIPGGERQREMAFRFGVNLVMYALAGNYKADQVHVPAILERLGQ